MNGVGKLRPEQFESMRTAGDVVEQMLAT